MSVIVDTVIWSLALRRNASAQNPGVISQLQGLIRNNLYWAENPCGSSSS